MILSQVLISQLAKGAARPAFRYLAKDIKLSDFVSTTARLSYLFQKEMGPQKRVAFIGSNSPALVAAFFAMSNNRSICIPMDPNLSDDDLCEWVYDTRPTHAIVTSDLIGRVRDLFRRRGIAVQVIDIEKKRGGEYSASFVPPPDNEPTEKDSVLLLRSAGTAGEYHYCTFNHIQIAAAVNALKQTYKNGTSEIFYGTLPWSHPFAFVHHMLFPILSGATTLVDHGLEGTEHLKFVREMKPTRVIGVPEYFQRLLLLCKQAQTPLTSIKSITVGLGDLSEAMCKIFGLMKIKVCTSYGQVENLWTITMSDSTEEHPGHHPVPVGLFGLQYKVVDKNGDLLEAKGPKEGQLCISGPTLMTGYYSKNEEKAKDLTRSKLRGTWLYTGDVFRLDDSGEKVHIAFVRRLDGLNPVPKLEDYFHAGKGEKALKAIEGISDCVVYREGGGEKGPIVCAIVGLPTLELTTFQILDRTKSALTPKNQITQVFKVDAIPRLEDGKVDFVELQKRVDMGPAVVEEKPVEAGAEGAVSGDDGAPEPVVTEGASSAGEQVTGAAVVGTEQAKEPGSGKPGASNAA